MPTETKETTDQELACKCGFTTTEPKALYEHCKTEHPDVNAYSFVGHQLKRQKKLRKAK